MPAVDTAIDCVVAPVDQRLPVADDEVRVIVPPVHESAEGPVMVGVAGAAFAATTNAVEVAEQPPALVTVTEYEPAAETAMDCVVAPVDQRFPVADDEVRVIVRPAQNDVGPLMVGVAAAGLDVMATAADVALQPPAFVTVTLYEPAVETVIDCVAAPVDQRLPVADDEVSVTVLPVQKELGPLMVGVTAAGLAATANGAEVVEQPPALVTVTV